MKKQIKWRYLGGGFLPGVPAKDLTAKEAFIYEKVIEKSSLYELVKEPKKKEAK